MVSVAGYGFAPWNRVSQGRLTPPRAPRAAIREGAQVTPKSDTHVGVAYRSRRMSDRMIRNARRWVTGLMPGHFKLGTFSESTKYVHNRVDDFLRGKNVLVVGINYAPEVTGIAPYTTTIAEHLAEQGASTTVLCGPPSYPAWRVEPAYRGWRRESTLNGVRVIRLWHYVPARQTGLRRAAYELSFGVHVALTRLPRRPDLVYTVIPSLAGSLAGLAIARRYDCPIIVHVQDLIGKAAEQSGMQGGARLAGAASTLEAFLLRRASLVVIITEMFRPVITAFGGDPGRVRLLRNWTHISKPRCDRQFVRQTQGWAEDVTVALHTGNMGWKQDLGNVVEAARLTAPNSKLLWVLMGDGSQRASLQAQAAGLPNLRFLPPCEAEVYPDILGAADVLLLNERPSLEEMSLPGKLTSYFSSGLPIVAGVAANSASAAELQGVQTVSVIPPGDPAALASACSDLRWAKQVHELTAAIAPPAHSRADAIATLDDILTEVFS